MAMSRRVNGPTPAGGAYSEACYYVQDARGNRRAAEEQDATYVEITEYSADGTVLHRTYALTGRGRLATTPE